MSSPPSSSPQVPSRLPLQERLRPPLPLLPPLPLHRRQVTTHHPPHYSRFFFARRAADGRAFEATGWVAPRCGRLLAFTSGQENLHGVQQVAAGRRCALALWFSHDPDYWEPEIGLAWDVVEAVRTGVSPSAELIHQLEELTMFSEAEARWGVSFLDCETACLTCISGG